MSFESFAVRESNFCQDCLADDNTGRQKWAPYLVIFENTFWQSDFLFGETLKHIYSFDNAASRHHSRQLIIIVSQNNPLCWPLADFLLEEEQEEAAIRQNSIRKSNKSRLTK